MKNKGLLTLIIIIGMLLIATGLFYLEFFHEQQMENDALIYEDIDLIIPIEEFLKRSVNSSNVSMVKRALINQWLFFNQADLIKLIVYAQGSRSYDEMKKALKAGFIQESSRQKAINFLDKTLQKIDQDKSLIDHVNKALQQGFPQDLHTLRAQIINHEDKGASYRKLSDQYRKKLYQWIDQHHGKFIDALILTDTASTN